MANGWEGTTVSGGKYKSPTAAQFFGAKPPEKGGTFVGRGTGGLGGGYMTGPMPPPRRVQGPMVGDPEQSPMGRMLRRRRTMRGPGQTEPGPMPSPAPISPSLRGQVGRMRPTRPMTPPQPETGPEVYGGTFNPRVNVGW